MARRQTLLFAAALTSMATLTSASSAQVAFSGCLGICVANSGCGSTNTQCVCSASAGTAFLDTVVLCVARFCLLSSGGADASTANDVVNAIDNEFLEVVATACAKDQPSVPASKISAALSTASSIVSEVLGATPGPVTTRTTVTTRRTTTVYRSTHTTQQMLTKTVPRPTDGAATVSSLTTIPDPSTDTSTATSDATDNSPPTDAKTEATTTKSTSTTKSTGTTTKEAPSRDTTDSSPFTNTNENAASRGRGGGPAPWQVAAAAALPMVLAMGLRLL